MLFRSDTPSSPASLEVNKTTRQPESELLENTLLHMLPSLPRGNQHKGHAQDNPVAQHRSFAFTPSEGEPPGSPLTARGTSSSRVSLSVSPQRRTEVKRVWQCAPPLLLKGETIEVEFPCRLINIDSNVFGSGSVLDLFTNDVQQTRHDVTQFLNEDSILVPPPNAFDDNTRSTHPSSSGVLRVTSLRLMFVSSSPEPVALRDAGFCAHPSKVLPQAYRSNVFHTIRHSANVYIFLRDVQIGRAHV